MLLSEVYFVACRASLSASSLSLIPMRLGTQQSLNNNLSDLWSLSLIGLQFDLWNVLVMAWVKLLDSEIVGISWIPSFDAFCTLSSMTYSSALDNEFFFYISCFCSAQGEANLAIVVSLSVIARTPITLGEHITAASLYMKLT